MADIKNKEIVLAYFEEVEVELVDGTQMRKYRCKGCQAGEDNEAGQKLYNMRQGNGNQNLANHVKKAHTDYAEHVVRLRSGPGISTKF